MKTRTRVAALVALVAVVAAWSNPVERSSAVVPPASAFLPKGMFLPTQVLFFGYLVADAEERPLGPAGRPGLTLTGPRRTRQESRTDPASGRSAAERLLRAERAAIARVPRLGRRTRDGDRQPQAKGRARRSSLSPSWRRSSRARIRSVPAVGSGVRLLDPRQGDQVLALDQAYRPSPDRDARRRFGSRPPRRSRRSRPRRGPAGRGRARRPQRFRTAARRALRDRRPPPCSRR